MVQSQQQRWNAYLYEGTHVLRNKKDITDGDAWAAAEQDYTLNRAATLPDLDVQQNSVLNNMKAIHFYLFQDCYGWAGKFRNVDMGKNNPFHLEGFNFFCDHDRIPYVLTDLQTLNDRLVQEASSLSTEEKITLLARFHAVLDFAHPFREGNGRSTRVLMEAMAEYVGIELDFGLITKEEIISAAQSSMSQRGHVHYHPVEELYAKIAKPIVERD
ncbi:MAG: Fic family protein [Corynebacterium sp.]|nr:Fic family protein [Corynebacterium sp.]